MQMHVTEPNTMKAILSWLGIPKRLVKFPNAPYQKFNTPTNMHCRLKSQDEQGHYRVSFGVHFPTCLHCVVYDSNTVSVLEDSKQGREGLIN